MWHGEKDEIKTLVVTLSVCVNELTCMLLHSEKLTSDAKNTENEPFSTAERSERVENFLFRATREYTEAGIEQRCLGAAPTVQNRAGAQ